MWKALLKYGTDIIHIMPGYALMEGINLQNPSGFVLIDVYFFCFCYISNVGLCQALFHLVKNGGPTVLCCHLHSRYYWRQLKDVIPALKWHRHDTQYPVLLTVHCPGLVTWTKGGLQRGLGNCQSRDSRKEIYLRSNLFILHLGMRDVYSGSWVFKSPGFYKNTHTHTHLLRNTCAPMTLG